MDDAAFLEILTAAESGGAKFPEHPPSPGLRGEAERLNHAESCLFIEGENADSFFDSLITLPTGSPLAARAERLRFMRKHRLPIRELFEKEPAVSPAFFHAFSAGPGPTHAKTQFVDWLHEGADRMKSWRSLRSRIRPKLPALRALEDEWFSSLPGGKTAKNTPPALPASNAFPFGFFRSMGWGKWLLILFGIKTFIRIIHMISR